MRTSSPPLLPPQIHPALGRGNELARQTQHCLDSGYPSLSRELPGGGWPLSTLIDLMPTQPGIGEVRLLQPALRQLPNRPIALLAPPQPPHIACWSDWQLSPQQLLWLRPQRLADTLWAAEQILRHDTCGALLCWADPVQHDALRRLHLSAQAGRTLFFLLRPAQAHSQPSPAPLRLMLAPAQAGIRITVLKRRGPTCPHPIHIITDPARLPIPHETLDRPALAQSQPRHMASALTG